MPQRNIIFLILGIAGIVVVAALLGRFIFFGAMDSIEEETTPVLRFPTSGMQALVGGEQSAGQQEDPRVAPLEATPLTPLSNERILGPTLLPSSAVARFYTAHEGRVFETTLDDSAALPREISSTVIDDLIDIRWSPDASAVVTLRDGNGEPRWGLFHYPTGTAQTLDPTTTDVVFSPDSKRFAYALPSGSDAVLFSATAQGTDVQRLTVIPDATPLLWWPTPDTLIAAQRPTGRTSSRFWTVPFPQGAVAELPSLIGADILPSPDGSRILVSHTTDSGRTLTLETRAPNGSARTSLVPSTIVDKCRWLDTNAVLCAVPDNLRGSIVDPLPDRYYQERVVTTDTFMVIDATSGRLQNVIHSPIPVDARNLLVPPSRDRILFTNHRDGRLYQLRVPEGL